MAARLAGAETGYPQKPHSVRTIANSKAVKGELCMTLPNSTNEYQLPLP
jgi:hypothetical protein